MAQRYEFAQLPIAQKKDLFLTAPAQERMRLLPLTEQKLSSYGGLDPVNTLA